MIQVLQTLGAGTKMVEFNINFIGAMGISLSFPNKEMNS